MARDRKTSTNLIGRMRSIDHLCSARAACAGLVMLAATPSLAQADCEALRDGVIVLASQLANQAAAIATSEERIRTLGDILAVAESPASELEDQQSAAERNLRVARQQYNEIVGRIADKGQQINEQCVSNG